MKWLRKHWEHVVGATLVAAVLGILIWGADSQQRYRAGQQACVDVVRCLDVGATRRQCDDMFPECEP